MGHDEGVFDFVVAEDIAGPVIAVDTVIEGSIGLIEGIIFHVQGFFRSRAVSVFQD